jgi:PAS domain S-box-containing protein
MSNVVSGGISGGKELEQRLELLAMILENVSESVVASDLEGRIVYWNRGASALWGYAREEVLGRDLAVLYPGFDRSARRADYERLLCGQDFVGEWTGYHKDGSAVCIDTHGRVMRDSRGQPIGIVGVAKDAAQRRRREEELRRAWERELRARKHAERISRAHEELTGIVSHDLRTPLSTIVVSAKVLREVLTEAERVEVRRATPHVDRIVRSAERMSRLIHGLLDLARIQAGTLLGDERVYSAAALLDDAVESLEVLALEKNQRIEVERPDPSLAVRCDLDAVRQVFSNLIGNGLRHSARGSAVRLSVRALPRTVEFSVADTGTGIAPDDLPHIFDRYWHAKHSRGGVGLGLSIVKGIVEAHGGNVHIESALGRGTTVSFRLPRITRSRSSPAAARGAAR